MTSLLSKVKAPKAIMVAFAAVLACMLVFGVVDASIADANGAFDKIDLGGKKVGTGKDLDKGLYKDMNVMLTVFLSIAGFVVIACLLFAGVKLATAQNNPQNRTQGFIGLGMALLGGWIVYKALDLAGWIKGFGS
ncbi:hypothetical protein [Viridibacillus arvi]|uniref:hypothetical protein n=1 Tax=Viridibacillus arvi TaxID=263475 RepID=UPI0034CEFA35